MSNSISRRKWLKYSFQTAALSTAAGILPGAVKAAPFSVIKQPAKNGRIVVVGAGAFGGWTALHLLRKGYEVTLIDQFGAGNNQSSSGGETRLVRPYYDDQQLYFDMVLRSIQIWKENEPLFGRKLFHQNGLLILHQGAEIKHEATALAIYKKAGLKIENLTPGEASKRWPHVATADLDHVIYDPNSGYLEAREGCRAVKELFIKEGGTFLNEQVLAPQLKNGKINTVKLSNGREVAADNFVFAGGPWLVRLFPEITKKLKVTRQGYFYFATPPQSSNLWEHQLPNWVNWPNNNDLSYGIPGNENRGFKVALTINDDITPIFDTYNRFLKPEELVRAQQLLATRFPALAGRPLIEQRVCQYTETPDKDFILDKHPEADNLWILGGGSGHGYKHGAALGEIAAKAVIGEDKGIERFKLNRLIS